MNTAMFILFLVLGLFGLTGAGAGYTMGRCAAGSPWQRRHLLQFWATLGIGFIVFVIPVLALALIVPTSDKQPALWSAMAWWMAMMDPILVAALGIWAWQWWRDLRPREADQIEIEGPSAKRLTTWVAVGTATPLLMLGLSFYGIFFDSNWQNQSLPFSTVERIVAETRDAKFEVYEHEDLSKTLFITLPGRKHIRFTAPADEKMLAFLDQKGVTYKTHVQGQDRNLDGLGTGAGLLILISGVWFAPAGAVVLLLQRKRKKIHPLPPASSAQPSSFDKMILTLRNDAATHWIFGILFSGLVLLSLAFFGFISTRVPVPQWPASRVSLKVETTDPQEFQREVSAIKADGVLSSAALQLNLNRKWGGKQKQTEGETLNLLRQKVSVWGNTNRFEITVTAADLDRNGAAKLANTIAQAFISQHDTSLPEAKIIRKAMPVSVFQGPNVRIYIVLIGLLVGSVLGILAGGGAAGLCALIRSKTAPDSSRPPSEPAMAGFTLIEMLVVIAIIGILASMLLPALSRGKQKAQGTYCLSNGKQMMIAITMYVGDNKDLFPPNPDDGNKDAGHDWVGGNAGRGAPDEFNPDILKDPAHSLLLPYLSGNVAVFHCPGDRRTGLYRGEDPSMLGTTVSAARTFSMNQAVGTICSAYDANMAHSGAPKLSVNGPWLNGQRTHRRDTEYYTYGNLSSIRSPGPSMLWVLVDEDARGFNSLNDAAFAFRMDTAEWMDAPGTYHSGGCGFAFADGHSESHGWHNTSIAPQSTAEEADWQWMRDRTSAKVAP